MDDRFQFSVRCVLLVTALVALSLASTLWKPTWVSVAVRAAFVIFIASLPILATAFSKGANKAFWIGVAVPAMLSALICAIIAVQIGQIPTTAMRNMHDMDVRLPIVVNGLNASFALCALAPINGLLCALTYRMLRLRNRKEESSAI
jgi:hypothetical protein